MIKYMGKFMTYKELRMEIKGTYNAGNYLKYHKQKVYGPITLKDEDDELIPVEEDDYQGIDID